MDGFIERVQSTARLFTPQQERASGKALALTRIGNLCRMDSIHTE